MDAPTDALRKYVGGAVIKSRARNAGAFLVHGSNLSFRSNLCMWLSVR